MIQNLLITLYTDYIRGIAVLHKCESLSFHKVSICPRRQVAEEPFRGSLNLFQESELSYNK